MERWGDIKSEFDVDGSLRDIYVENTTENQWNHFINEISSSNFQITFTHGGVTKKLPNNFQDIKKLQEENPTTLAILLDNNILVHCHFFIISEIELDITPEHINDENGYNAMLSFINWLSSILDHIVILTHENAKDMVILKSRP